MRIPGPRLRASGSLQLVEQLGPGLDLEQLVVLANGRAATMAAATVFGEALDGGQFGAAGGIDRDRGGLRCLLALSPGFGSKPCRRVAGAAGSASGGLTVSPRRFPPAHGLRKGVVAGHPMGVPHAAAWRGASCRPWLPPARRRARRAGPAGRQATELAGGERHAVRLAAGVGAVRAHSPRTGCRRGCPGRGVGDAGGAGGWRCRRRARSRRGR